MSGLKFKLLKIQLKILKTQQIREKAAKQLQKWISEAEKAAGQSDEDPDVKREWLKLAGFLHQILNSLLKSYDATRFNEDLQEAEKLIEELKKKQEELEAWEQELRLKEGELNRKLAAIEKGQKPA